MTGRSGRTAIVIGASVAGLATARVLSDHVERVTIIERDHLPDEPVVRRSVPQGRHAHVLLAAGTRLLSGWFPGLMDGLVAAGAVPFDSGDLVWHQGGAYWAMPDAAFPGVSMSQPLLETAIRRHLLRDRPHVRIVDRTAVDGLIVENGRVVGVTSDSTERRADLVVACTGRNTRFLDHLAGHGFPVPDISAVRVDGAYATRMLRRPPARGSGPVLVLDDAVNGRRIGTVLPVEDGRWIVTLGGFHGDAPPTDPDGFEGFARTLPSPVPADILTGCEALTPVLTHRLPTSQRRHVERLRRTPAGFVVLGDAICSVNPLYGQGMTSAALQAAALGRTVERHGPLSPLLPTDFYRRAAAVVDLPWRIAAFADFTHPGTNGSRPSGTGPVNRYVAQVMRACHSSVPVTLRMLRVQNLLARPESLMRPATVVRVLLAARRSPAGHRSDRNSSMWDRNSGQAGSAAVSR